MIARADLRGFQGSLRKMREVGEKHGILQKVALRQLAEKAFVLSKEYCPKDTLALVSSARLTGDSGGSVYSSRLGSWTDISGGGAGTGLNSQFTISYNEFYAVYVHEDLNARHDPGTKAKYLEHAVRETIPEYAGILRDTFDREFKAT